MSTWTCALALDAGRRPIEGREEALVDAIRRGADLRIQTEFRHNEHVDATSDNTEIIREVSDFRLTYLLEDRWVAGVMTLRQPIHPPDGFGPRPSMSFFMYNQNGLQAIARPYLDGVPAAGMPGPSQTDNHVEMPKYHEHDAWDADTNAPSSNFVYDFETYRFWVLDEWEEVLSHAADGTVTSGSFDALVDAFSRGRDIKVGIRNLCSDLSGAGGDAMTHEVFIQTGPGYYQTETRLFCAGSYPLVRVTPAIPMRYGSKGWDFGWVLLRTDGVVSSLIYGPYTLQTRRRETRHAIRWFVR